ncbi:MAG: protein-L-isoaspartate O-methyltransferase [Proteobacteria bacterium]|nr:MAG: protein-L-isoaspartate O-methyltransferase [Pseudomonadota bacterium]
MVEEQIEDPLDGREQITNKKVLEALGIVPRHVFVPSDSQDRAYTDRALAIGHGQTISQPYIVALMTELLELTPDSKVLEIGTGSGYQAAVLAQLTPHVYSIEIVKPLAESAAEILKKQGYSTINLKHGDGYLGWPEHAPFDAITVTCAENNIPMPLWEQLKEGGRMVIPLGEPGGSQELIRFTKGPGGKRIKREVTAVRFVPLVRAQ